MTRFNNNFLKNAKWHDDDHAPTVSHAAVLIDLLVFFVLATVVGFASYHLASWVVA